MTDRPSCRSCGSKLNRDTQNGTDKLVCTAPNCPMCGEPQADAPGGR